MFCVNYKSIDLLLLAYLVIEIEGSYHFALAVL